MLHVGFAGVITEDVLHGLEHQIESRDRARVEMVWNADIRPKVMTQGVAPHWKAFRFRNATEKYRSCLIDGSLA